jgi:hypothetical protein
MDQILCESASAGPWYSRVARACCEVSPTHSVTFLRVQRPWIALVDPSRYNPTSKQGVYIANNRLRPPANLRICAKCPTPSCVVCCFSVAVVTPKASSHPFVPDFLGVWSPNSGCLFVFDHVTVASVIPRRSHSKRNSNKPFVRH